MSMISQAESMVSGGSGNDPTCFFLIRQHDQSVPCPSLLEAASVLHEVFLQEDVHPRVIRKVGALQL